MFSNCTNQNDLSVSFGVSNILYPIRVMLLYFVLRSLVLVRHFHSLDTLSGLHFCIYRKFNCLRIFRYLGFFACTIFAAHVFAISLSRALRPTTEIKSNEHTTSAYNDNDLYSLPEVLPSRLRNKINAEPFQYQEREHKKIRVEQFH